MSYFSLYGIGESPDLSSPAAHGANDHLSRVSHQSHLSTNDNDDNEMISGAVHRSPDIYLTAKKPENQNYGTFLANEHLSRVPRQSANEFISGAVDRFLVFALGLRLTLKTSSVCLARLKWINSRHAILTLIAITLKGTGVGLKQVSNYHYSSQRPQKL